jgi:hypothetical protein
MKIYEYIYEYINIFIYTYIRNENYYTIFDCRRTLKKNVPGQFNDIFLT